MHKSHDHSYKLLFSSPEIVEDLLQGFVKEPWVDELDFATLEKVSGHYVTDDLRDREDDIVWRVQHKKRWVYVYLLIEFQSTVDRYMAVRVPLYILLLYQDLIKNKVVGRGELLPPVFPVVLYNGEKRWNSTTQLSDLIVDLPGGLERYKPAFEYLLLDEGAYRSSDLEHLGNLVAAIFRLENASSREDIISVVDDLILWLEKPEQETIRRDFTVWIKRVLLPTKSVTTHIQEINDLTEIRTMLAQTVSKMTEEWVLQGRTEGRIEGKVEGKIEGKIEGKVEGKIEGKIEGERILLLRLIRHRFGEEVTFQAQPVIDSIRSLTTLEIIGNWVVDATNGDDLLEKLRTI